MTSRRNTSRRRCIPFIATRPSRRSAGASVACRDRRPSRTITRSRKPQQYADEPLQDPSRYDDALYGRLETGEHDYQRDPAYPDDPYAYQGEYEEEPAPKKRSSGLMTVAAVLALAVVGTGAAFAYRTFVGSPRSGEPPIIRADNSPTKVVPAPSDAVPPRLPTACCRAMAARSWCRAKRRRSTSIPGPAGRAWCFRR